MNAFTRKAEIALALTKILLLVLIIFISGWTLWISPMPLAKGLTIALIQVLPLILFLPGILKGRQRTAVWLCFVILVYFCGGVIWTTSTEPMVWWLGFGQGVMSLLLFATAMLFVRWHGKARKADEAAASQA